MSESLITSMVTVLTAIVGVAVIAVLVSRNAQTPQVISAGGSAFSQALSAATGPVTGGGFGGFGSGSMVTPGAGYGGFGG